MLAAFTLSVGLSGSVSAKVIIDTSAARATLEALLDSKLSRTQALGVADLSADQALIRKMNELDRTQATTRDSFADTLVEVAHGLPPTRSMGFKSAKEKSAVTIALIERIEREPKQFKDWV